MVVSGHQPCYLPWLGLFHKLYLSDVFVYMDTVQFLDRSWNHRNKIKTPHGAMWLTLPIDRRRSTGKMLHEIMLANTGWQEKHWKAIELNYRRSPFWDQYAPELYNIYTGNRWERLVDLCWAQFDLFQKWLGIERPIVKMSEMRFEGRKDELVLDHCKKLGADRVVFGALGKNYVRVELFRRHGISVVFQDYRHPEYTQRFGAFVSHLSLVDLVFNHGPNSRSILLSGNLSREELLAGKADYHEGPTCN